MKYLVGNTGFVGSNIAGSGDFDGLFHATNIADAYGAKPELLVYAGLRAEKYLANKDPERDMVMIEQAFQNICRIEPQKLVLISSVDVYKQPVDVDENTAVDTRGLLPYGYNRYQFEQKVRERMPDALIIRLPGLYGMNLKKNFVFDLIHRIPTMLDTAKYDELCMESKLIEKYYMPAENGFYKVRKILLEERCELRKFFDGCGFSALNFTDSRSVFQMYPLRLLWGHIQTALDKDLRLINMAVEPITVQEIYRAVEGGEFVNELPGIPAKYLIKTCHDALYGGKDGYILDKALILGDIASFINREKVKLLEEDDDA